MAARVVVWNRLRPVMVAAKPAGLLDGAIRLSITIFVARPGAHFRTGKNAGLKPSGPRLPKSGKDLDKVARAIGDCGTGIIYTNDARICDLTIRRRYADTEPECAVIQIEELE